MKDQIKYARKINNRVCEIMKDHQLSFREAFKVVCREIDGQLITEYVRKAERIIDADRT